MRTNFIIMSVMALAIAGLFMSASGFNAVAGVGQNPTGGIGDEFSDKAGESDAIGENESFSGTRAGGESSSIVGLVLGGARKIATMLSMVVLLPRTLANIGFPAWFAGPVGTIGSLLASVGLIQFVTGRDLR